MTFLRWPNLRCPSGTCFAHANVATGEATATRAPSDPAEFAAATERVVEALFDDLVKASNQIEDGFDKMRPEAVEEICVDALVVAENLRLILAGLVYRRVPREMRRKIGDIETMIEHVFGRNEARMSVH